MSNKVRWGVIACGGIAARRTIPEYLQMASCGEIVAVMDIAPERARDIAKKFNIPFFCDNEKELLNQKIDAVYIASPQNEHCRQVIMAAQTGKHILCEKPMALSLGEVDRMEMACRKTRVKFMLGFCMRNNIYNEKARELVQSGALGQIVMGRAQLTCWYPPIPDAWRQDIAISRGGALIDMGTHCLDILEWIMGTTIVEVAGFQDLLVHKYRTKIEDTSTILVRFANGAHGIIDNYFNLPDAVAQNSLELHGTKGSIMGHGTIGQDPTGHMFSIIQPQETGYNAGQNRTVEAKRQEYDLKGESIYGRMMEIFSRCILDDTEPPVSIADGCRSVAVVEAVYKAVAERRVVKVNEILSANK
ncbi:MAG: Gfo/Idh/MocA family oxidoreductase [Kiritimatiellae bacterium]|nr:Gfo/Idh/MocA family oxidoreductase [Kiritimatiellia bacterium]